MHQGETFDRLIHAKHATQSMAHVHPKRSRSAQIRNHGEESWGGCMTKRTGLTIPGVADQA